MPRRLPNSLTTPSNRDIPDSEDVEPYSFGCLPLILIALLVPVGFVLTILNQPSGGSFLGYVQPLALAPSAFAPFLAFLGLSFQWTVALSFVLFSGYLFFGVLPIAVGRKWFSFTACLMILILFSLNITGCIQIVSDWNTWEDDLEQYQQTP